MTRHILIRSNPRRDIGDPVGPEPLDNVQIQLWPPNTKGHSRSASKFFLLSLEKSWFISLHSYRAIFGLDDPSFVRSRCDIVTRNKSTCRVLKPYYASPADGNGTDSKEEWRYLCHIRSRTVYTLLLNSYQLSRAASAFTISCCFNKHRRLAFCRGRSS